MILSGRVASACPFLKDFSLPSSYPHVSGPLAPRRFGEERQKGGGWRANPALKKQKKTPAWALVGSLPHGSPRCAGIAAIHCSCHILGMEGGPANDCLVEASQAIVTHPGARLRVPPQNVGMLGSRPIPCVFFSAGANEKALSRLIHRSSDRKSFLQEGCGKRVCGAHAGPAVAAVGGAASRPWRLVVRRSLLYSRLLAFYDAFRSQAVIE